MPERERLKKEGIWIEDFLIRISPDDMLLYVDIKPSETPLVRDFLRKWELIKEKLKEFNFFGVLETPEISEEKIIVGKGTPPTPPIPEKIELFDKFKKLLGKLSMDYPSKSERSLNEMKNKVSLRDLPETIICVDKEEPIGKWYPFLPGINGVNIWGEPVPPPSVDTSKTFNLGKNLYIDSNNLIRAKEGGVILLQQNTLEVFPEFVLKGDVDFSTGNINFIGKKLTIQGDVKFGFKVKVKGDLELYGTTENKVYIEVDGNFKCDGIIRGEDTVVKVSGNAEIKGIEYAKIEIKGNLLVKNYIVFAEVTTEGELSLISGKGVIYGGVIRCCGNIEAKVLGNEKQTLTKVFAGYKKDLIDLYFRVFQEVILYEETIRKICSGLELGEKLLEEGRVSPEKEKIIKILRDQYQIYLGKLESLKQRLKEIKKELTFFKERYIKVLDKLFPGVMVGIADITHVVSEEIRGPILIYLDSSCINFKRI